MPNQKGRVVTIEFDGVYDYSEVWINGQFVGGRPYGFSSFQLDLTPFIKFGSDDNVIAVRVDHSRFADSRFYTGSGIYRNVRLVITDKLRIAHWGAYVTTPKIKTDSATVRVETTVENGSADKKEFSLQSDIVAPGGEIVASLTTSKSAAANSTETLVQDMKILKPQLWSPDSPSLYTLKSHVASGGAVVDETETPFGIRTATFDADKGFLLNGVSTKLKGVCLHHDAGALGAAVPEKVLERRLRLLKEIGVNAIRTSHNPPDPELLDLCDRLGFLVMDEAFDEFTPGKNKWVTGWNNGVPDHFGYNEIFAQWSVTDIQDMVRRDRNHPGIMLWSIGNEVDYANDPFSDPVLGDKYQPENPPAKDLLKCAQPLITAVKSLDRTRPVTAALANIKMSDAVNLPELLDAVGYNYQESRYAADHEKFPKRIIYGSENSHQYARVACGAKRTISSPASFSGRELIIWARRAPGRTRERLGSARPLRFQKAGRLVPAKPLERQANGLSLRRRRQRRTTPHCRCGKLELAVEFNADRPLFRQLPRSHPDAERQSHWHQKAFRSRQRRVELEGSFRTGNAQGRWPRERAGRLRLRIENRRSGQPD